jgi:serine palmitoyltransferase
VEEWQPEPLVEPETAEELIENEKRPTIIGATGPKSRIATASGSKLVTNLASYNFYNFVGNETLKEKAIQTLRKYGVGPCGPPGFYGTQDVHMEAEKAVATHIGVPNSIIYAQAFSTISSVIPAFSKRGDIIVADKAVNYSIRKGLQISRSTVYWYEHNDMADLERILQKIVKEQAKKPLTRRFIVSEGLFENVGDVVDLPRLVELKHRYKFRIILDETWSYGVLGEGGRGVTEAQNVDPNQVDMLIGSLAGPICSGGGFCAGAAEVVEHQRIMASAYTYSAALPAMLATTAVETIQILKESPEVGQKLQENIDSMWAQFDPKNFPKQQWVVCTSAKQNPIMLFTIKEDLIARYELSVKDQESIIQEVVEEVRKHLCTAALLRLTLLRHSRRTS